MYLKHSGLLHCNPHSIGPIGPDDNHLFEINMIAIKYFIVLF